jgi:phosphohistidine phosphatase SixA
MHWQKRGKKQARQVAAIINPMSIQKVYTSELRRAKETWAELENELE